MVTRKDKRRECPHCGRVTDNPNETTCTACGYLTREVKKVVTKGKTIDEMTGEVGNAINKAVDEEIMEHVPDEDMVDLSEEEK